MTVTAERRAAKRYQLDWPVCVWHEPTQRFVNGRSVNISSSGALLRLPLSVPLRMADNLEVNFTAAEGAETQGNPARVFSSEVVRVNRGQTILEGEQLVAVTFE